MTSGLGVGLGCWLFDLCVRVCARASQRGQLPRPGYMISTLTLRYVGSYLIHVSIRYLGEWMTSGSLFSDGGKNTCIWAGGWRYTAWAPIPYILACVCRHLLPIHALLTHEWPIHSPSHGYDDEREVLVVNWQLVTSHLLITRLTLDANVQTDTQDRYQSRSSFFSF